MRQGLEYSNHKRVFLAVLTLLAVGQGRLGNLSDGSNLYRALSVVAIKILDVLDLDRALALQIDLELDRPFQSSRE